MGIGALALGNRAEQETRGAVALNVVNLLPPTPLLCRRRIAEICDARFNGSLIAECLMKSNQSYINVRLLEESPPDTKAEAGHEKYGCGQGNVKRKESSRSSPGRTQFGLPFKGLVALHQTFSDQRPVEARITDFS